MIAYKASYNQKCRGVFYEVGQTRVTKTKRNWTILAIVATLGTRWEVNM